MERSHDEEITLVTVTQDEAGIEQKEIVVFAAKVSVTRSEFYAAYRTGMDAKWIFSLNREDFEMTREVVEEEEVYASQVKYKGAVFDVIRTYCPEDGDLEIVVK